MAHVLDIVDGSGTITLNSSSKRVISYIPQSPQLSVDQLRQIVIGSPLNESLTVTESALVEISGANAAAVQTAIQALEKALTFHAYQREMTGQGNRVFVQYTPDSTSGAYRSEIVDSRIELNADSQDYGRWFTNFKVNITIGWRRRFYWEAVTETTLPVGNANGTAVTGGTVYNHDDSGATDDNFLSIASGDAAGVIPTPFKIEIVNTYGTAARRIYIGHKAQGDAANFQHIYEVEAATIAGIGARSGVAASSGGTVVTYTNFPTGGTVLASWPITATQAGYIKNQWVRPIVRFSTLPNTSTMKCRFVLKDTTTLAVIYTTDWQLLSTTDYLQALPEIYFSQQLQGQTTSGGMTLNLEGKDSAGTGDCAMDFLQLTPMEAGQGFVFLRPIDETLVTLPGTATASGTITYNPIDGATYIESRQNVYQVYGGPLMCVPATAQRLYFLTDGTADADVARTLTVKAYIRPRRITI